MDNIISVIQKTILFIIVGVSSLIGLPVNKSTTSLPVQTVVPMPDTESAADKPVLPYVGNGSVNVWLELSKTVDSPLVAIMMVSDTGGERVKAIGIDVTFDQTALAVSDVVCGQDIPSAIAGKVDPNTGSFNLTCFKPGGSGDLVFEKGRPVVLGSFLVDRVGGGPVVSNIFITDAGIPDSADYHNLAGKTNGLEIDFSSGSPR